MLIIKTYLKETENKGLGLFTAEPLVQGRVIYIYEAEFSKVFTNHQYLKMAKLQKEYMNTYAILQKDNSWFLDLDNTRFMNHSYTPNIRFRGDTGIALQNIPANSELFCDYNDLVEGVDNINFEIID